MTETTTTADIRSSQQGDQHAFARVVRAHYSYAYSVALRLVLDESDADDVVQEGFVRVWKNLNRFDPNTRFTTWLYRIVTNVSLDVIRARKRRPMTTDRQPDEIPMGENADVGNPEEFTSNRDMIEHIERLAADLPDTQRLVFTLRDIQDLTIEEVCECTGLSSESVRTNLHYARKRLREHFEKEYDMQRRMP